MLSDRYISWYQTRNSHVSSVKNLWHKCLVLVCLKRKKGSTNYDFEFLPCLMLNIVTSNSKVVLSDDIKVVLFDDESSFSKFSPSGVGETTWFFNKSKWYPSPSSIVGKLDTLMDGEYQKRNKTNRICGFFWAPLAPPFQRGPGNLDLPSFRLVSPSR